MEENTENNKQELTVSKAKEILLEHRDYCSPDASKYDELLVNAINTVLNELDNAMDFIKKNKFYNYFVKKHFKSNIMETENKLPKAVVLKDQYREEKENDVYSDDGYSDDYVHWLEKKCIELQKLIKPKKNKV